MSKRERQIALSEVRKNGGTERYGVIRRSKARAVVSRKKGRGK